MSGLLEKIVQRRRATAAQRLGPPAQNGAAAPAQTWARPAPAPAVGAPEPEPPDPGPQPRAAEPPPLQPEPVARSRPATASQRARLRRRVRFLRQLRELQLRDIGGFLVELHRFGRQRPDLIEAKVQEAAATDHELRALERALGEHRPVDEVRQAGVGGACPDCGNVHGSSDQFCSWCGRQL